MLQHAIVLQVVIPLLGAPLCAFVPRAKLAWGFATLVTWCAFAMSLMLLMQVNHSGAVTYALGNWAPPIGIEYRVDMLSAAMLVLVSGMGAVGMPYALVSISKEIEETKQSLFYTMYLLCLAGLLGMIVTHDAFNVFVFLEISSLSTYTLIALGKSRRSLFAAFEYLVLGTIGATFYLIGVGLLYIKTGTLNMGDLARLLPELWDNSTIKTALAFITIGLALKFALFPLHLWLCNAYAYAPSFVSAFLAGTATKVSLYVLLRIVFTVFGLQFAFQELPLGALFMALAFFAVLVGSFVAVFQPNVKRMLAYSSVAQIGYIVMGISLASQAGVTAGLLHIFNHALAKGALFLVVGCVFYRLGSVQLEDFRGLGKHMPFTMAAFVMAAISLIGLPLTAGFISKWYLFDALIGEGRWLLLAAVITSSLLSLVYIGRVVEMAYFKERQPHDVAVAEAPWMLLLPCWVLVLLNLGAGIFSAQGVDVATRIAGRLVDGGM